MDSVFPVSSTPSAIDNPCPRRFGKRECTSIGNPRSNTRRHLPLRTFGVLREDHFRMKNPQLRSQVEHRMPADGASHMS